jgi:hypothetical protein
MSEFTPINTQDEFDAAIKDRLARQESKIRGEYADYDNLKKQADTWAEEKQSYEKTIADSKTAFDDLNQKYTDATGKIAQYETDALKTKIAIESGLPVGMFSYLKGSTEEEIKQSAEELGKFTKGSQVLPLANPEGEPSKNDFERTGKVNEERVRQKFINSFKILEE